MFLTFLSLTACEIPQLGEERDCDERTLYYRDQDEDGWGGSEVKLACSPEDGWVLEGWVG